MSQDSLIRLQCSECKNYNYQTKKNPKGGNKEKLELKKFCKACKSHKPHKQKPKK